jgi:hypothetical protein
MPAGQLEPYTINIQQGSDLSVVIYLKDPSNTAINLTGATGTGQIRKTASSSSIVQTFTVVVTGALTGEVTISLTDTQTTAIPVEPSRQAERTVTEYAYDVQMTYADGTVQRVLEGVARVSPGVTR